MPSSSASAAAREATGAPRCFCSSLALVTALDLAAIRVLNAWDAKAKAIREVTHDSTIIYQLRHWVSLGPDKAGMAYARVLAAMSRRPVTRKWIATDGGLSGDQTDSLLAELQTRGALKVLDCAVMPLTPPAGQRPQTPPEGDHRVRRAPQALALGCPFRRRGARRMSTPRIVLFGPMGIGKTTAVRTLCGDAVIDCDVVNLDTDRNDKATTTVGADFGVVRLDGGEELLSTAVRDRIAFSFMRQWLLTLAVGVMVRVDIAEPGALATTEGTITEICELAPEAAVVVVVARPAIASAIQIFAEELAGHLGWAIPVVPVDVRRRDQMLDSLELQVASLPDHSS